LGLLLGFFLQLGFYTPIEGIRVLGVLLESLYFTSSLSKDALDDEVQHINAFPSLGDVYVTFGILISYFVQRC
jgi:hypothetical protein